MLSASGALATLPAAELFRENLLEAGDRLLPIGHGMDSAKDGLIMIRDDTSQMYPHPQSRLIQHDLCAQLAPLDRYGLAEFSSALVVGLLALATWSKSAFAPTHRSSTDCQGRTAS
jgi:hypothetical protein